MHPCRRIVIGLVPLALGACAWRGGTSVGTRSRATDSARVYEGRAEALLDDSVAVDRASQSLGAANLYRQAVTFFERSGRPTDAARSLRWEAEAYRRAGVADSVAPLQQRALAGAERIGAHGEISAGLFDVANRLATRGGPGDVDSARALVRRSLPEATAAGDWHAEMKSLMGLAYFHGLAGRRDSAIAYTGRAMRIAEAHADTIAVRNQLDGAIHDYEFMPPARPDSAMPYVRRAMGIDLARGDLSAAMAAFLPAAYMLGENGQRDSAFALYREALALVAHPPATVTERERLRAYTPYLNMGRWFDQADQLDSASAYLRVALANAREYDRLVRADGATSGEEALVLMQQSAFLVGLGRLDSAEASARAALASLNANAGLRRSANVQALAKRRQDALRNLVNMLSRTPDSAVVYARLGLEDVRKNPPVHASLAADARRAEWMATLGTALGQAGRLDSARFWLDSAYAVSDVDTRPNILSQRANLLVREGKVDSAVATLWQVADAYARRNGADMEGSALVRLSVELAAGSTDSALHVGRRALAVHQRTKTRPNIANANSAIAGAFSAMGYADSAVAYRRAALQGWRGLRNRRGEAGALISLGGSYRFGDYPDSAFVFLRAALAIGQELHDARIVQSVISQTALVFGTLGRADSSIYYARAALDSAAANHDRAGAGSAHDNLGILFAQARQFDSARTHLTAALATWDSIGSRVSIPGTSTWLAVTYARSGQPDSALATARRALPLLRASGRRGGEVRGLIAIGDAFAARKQGDSSLAAYQSALELARTIHSSPDEREILTAIADLRRTAPPPLRDVSRAAAYYDSAAAVAADVRHSMSDDATSVSFAESQRDLFAGWTRAWLGLRPRVGEVRAVTAALGAVERGRAQALLDFERRSSTRRGGANDDEIPAPGRDLARETDSLLAGLRARHAAALSYAIVDDTLLTWYLRPDGALILLPPRYLPAGHLASLVAAVAASMEGDHARSAMLDPDDFHDRAETGAPPDKTPPPTARGGARRPPRATDDSLLAELSRLLLPADLGDVVPRGGEIVVIPSGPIAAVPFAALPSRTRTGGATTVGMSYAVRYAPSFAALRAAERRPSTLAGGARPHNGAGSRTSQAVVVGNPEMPYVYAGRWRTRSQLQPLPGAAAEARAIATRLGAELLTGSRATATTVRARMAMAPIIHLATHGLSYTSESKARRSFVALAPDSMSDGLLTAASILDPAAPALRADLVVLSACQTGLGSTTSNEGTVGLQRAFLARGARSVLVSLWNVDDRATQILVARFYAHWIGATGSTPRASEAEALRRAQRDLAGDARFSSPRYWAAFQLVGAG